jgi:thiamine biosynthesis lipoprotein ApbE
MAKKNPDPVLSAGVSDGIVWSSTRAPGLTVAVFMIGFGRYAIYSKPDGGDWKLEIEPKTTDRRAAIEYAVQVVNAAVAA